MAEENEQSENGINIPPKDSLLVVGIGASAGGIEALQEFFTNTPPDSNIAYVVILHLSPDHDSHLADILRRTTTLPVAQVMEKVKVERNHIYVIPPNKHLTIRRGEIEVSVNQQIEDRRAPVDIFFRTLAEAYQSRSVGVILSGTGANGSMGIKRIKERGGAAFVQNPREAHFNEMPRNSIATDLIDDILPVAEIPAKIIAYQQSLGTIQIAVENVERTDDQQQALREIFNQLRLRTTHDFSNYKRATLLRRIERRINVHALPSLTAYATFLTQNLEEPKALLKDLLISVTNFFRDADAFDVIEKEVLLRIFENKGPGNSIRLWTIGCATGEEAYSLAMFCVERLTGLLDAPKVQIFATDIDETALSIARDGVYTLNDAADVSPDRLRRFFVKDGDDYRVRREIREMVLFANHDVLKDPPFSHLDLVTCRNMMIYLNNTAQERVLETVHFALEPGGFLFLGSSESVEGAGDLFATVNRDYHIYQSRAVASRHFPVPEKLPTFQFIKKEENNTPIESDNHTNGRISFADLHQQLLELYAPPSVIVNEEYDILHLTDRAGRYLQMGAGEPSKNLLKLVRPELRLELRTALYSASQGIASVEARGLKVKIDDTIETINILVRPVLRQQDTARGFMLVLFEQGTAAETEVPKVITSEGSVAHQLEHELIQVKAQLRNTSEQHDMQAEELRASNEELQAMNEELRSAAEELETSKEELQSINEELITVNQELKIKVEETSISNSNFQNLINSTYIATVFLDRNFRINMFTPAACDIFNVIPADTGRPLSDITNKLEYDGLEKDVAMVLDKLKMIEREVRTADGTIYLMRAQPYRTEEDRINGVVLTFIDITERKAADEALRKSDERFRAFVTASSDVIYRMSADWLEMYYLKGSSFLANTEDTTRTWFTRYIPESEHPRVHTAISEAIRNKTVFELEHQVYRADGTIGWALSRAVPLFNEAGVIAEWFGAATDVTARKEGEVRIRESEELLRVTMESAVDYVIITFDAAGIIKTWNTGAERIFGFTVKEAIGQNGDIIFTDEDKKRGRPEEERATARTEGRAIDERWHQRKDGSKVFISGVMARIRDSKITGFVKVARDVTEEKKAQEALHKSEQRFRALIDKGTDVITISNKDGVITYASPSIEPITGYKVDEFVGHNPQTENRIHPDDLPLCKEVFEKLLKSPGESIFIQHRYLHKEGEWRWLEGTFTSLFHDPSINGLVANYRDITERKKAEETLHDSEERYRIAIEAGELATWDWNMNTDEIAWNEQHFQLFGKSFEDSLQTPEDFLSQIHEEDLAYVKKQLFEAAETTGVYFAEFRIVRQDNGRIRWMTGYGRVTEREEGKATRMTGVMFDSTKQKEAEEELLSVQHSLNTALDAAQMGVWDLDLITRDTNRSPRHDQLLGFVSWQEQWSPVKAKQNIIEEDKPKFDEAYNNLEVNGIFQLEARVKHTDGSICWIYYFGRAFKNEEGKYQSAAGVIFDITDRKTVEKQKDEFLGIASHELKTPVTSIKAYAEILQETFSEAKDVNSARLMAKLDNQVDRLTKLIKDLLDVTKVSEGQLHLTIEKFSVEELIDNMVEEMQRTARQHTIRLTVSKLPAISGDKERIGQVLTNLLSNAIKYSPKSNEILVNAKHEENKIVISVTDFGIGMSQGTVSRLFERFFRSDNPMARSYPGLGLGLYISMEIMKRHKGTITVKSEKDKGSTFTMMLPTE